MTEYDYSPAAYERYMAQQARVSNWVDDTLQQAHAYSNPFVLSPTLRDRTFYDEPDDPPSSMSSRPSRERSRSYVDHSYHHQPPRYRSQSHSRTRDVQVVYPQQHYPAPHPHAARSPPRIHTSPPYHYPTQQSPTRPNYMSQPPPPPPGQIYGPPAKLDRHTRHTSAPPQPYLLVQGGGPKAEYKRGPPIHAPIPTKPHGTQQPLLKRLLGFVTMSPVGGRSANNRGYRY